MNRWQSLELSKGRGSDDPEYTDAAQTKGYKTEDLDSPIHGAEYHDDYLFDKPGLSNNNIPCSVCQALNSNHDSS